MSWVWSQLPALQIVVPMFGAALIALINRPNIAFVLAAAISLLMPAIAGGLLTQVLTTGPISYAMGGWNAPIGIEFRIDQFNASILLLVSMIAAVAIPFAYRSVKLDIYPDRQAGFYSVYLLYLTGLLGVAITGDAFNAFVFLEVSSLSTYVLVALNRDRRALLASFQYLMLGTIGATFYVIGVGFLYILTGTLNMADLAVRIAAIPPEQQDALIAALAFITAGIGLKVALFPLHVWMPNAYAYAPSFVSVVLSATATKVAIYLLIRYHFSIFGFTLDPRALPISYLLVGLSLAAMYLASVVAVFEGNLKRMLAYSSISQVGYITLGVGLANQAGMTGALVHIANHAVMKAALFLAVGAVAYRFTSIKREDLAGLGRRMPITMTVFTIAGLGLVGVPGTAGFISKWYLALGALDKGWWPIMLLIVGSSFVTLIYVGRVLEIVWLHEPSETITEASDPPLSMLVPMLLLAAATIYFGFRTDWTVSLAAQAAAMLLGGLP